MANEKQLQLVQKRNIQWGNMQAKVGLGIGAGGRIGQI